METLIGRLVSDAKIKTLKDDKKVVDFSIALNESYKAKGAGEIKKITTYVNCSYWMSTTIAQYLLRGTLVELYGRIGVNAYNNLQGEAKASLTLHVNNIKLHGKSSAENGKVTTASAADATQPADDLPF